MESVLARIKWALCKELDIRWMDCCSTCCLRPDWFRTCLGVFSVFFLFTFLVALLRYTLCSTLLVFVIYSEVSGTLIVCSSAFPSFVLAVFWFWMGV